MRVCIHRGTQEIGGTCVEIEAQGNRLVLEVGLPLDAPDTEALLPPVSGFRKKDETLLGVVISHPHQDHYGLAKYLRLDLPIFVGAAASRILDAAANFIPAGATFLNAIYLKDLEPMQVGPFEITPYLIDHSAYDAYAFLVAADNKRLFYTGDLRAHGAKATLFERLVRKSPKDVDVLLLEGSTIGRLKAEGRFPTERELEVRFIKEMKSTKGMVLVYCSGQNIDRIVTVFRACKQSQRQMIIDLYTAVILRATENPHIPQGDWPGVRVFIPQWQRRLVKRKQLFHLLEIYKKNRIFPKELREIAAHATMLFRPSMATDLEQAGCLQEAGLIYSLWGGYLEKESIFPFLNWLDYHRIPMSQIHTSGHASISDLKRLARAINARTVVPIHSFEPGRFPEFFDKVKIKEDGVWWGVE
ncbi:MAG: MBL fold metallo-hydrolase [Desulfobaccales bacterium]